MLASMGQPPPGVVQQGASSDDASRQIQNEFVDLETGIQQFMKKITDLAGQYPAFNPQAQQIAQAATQVSSLLNDGMMSAIKQLSTTQPQAPPTGY